MAQNSKLGTRLTVYFLGLFIMTAGIALSVKSNLGVSPVSSIPYSITCIFNIEMGNATILFHIGLVILQILLLGKNFKAINLLQIPVGIIFGKFTTLCNSLVMLLPPADSIVIRLIMMFASAILIAVGIFFYMPANIMPLAGEGAIAAISQVTHFEFAKVKTGFDISMVTISLISCILLIHSLGSVGIGTAIASIFVGTSLGFIEKYLGTWRNDLLGVSEEPLQLTDE